MGTNYYLKKDYCVLCGRYDKVHIGKRSLGWKFMFRVTDVITSIEDWFREIDKSGGVIVDEYDENISIDKFKDILQSNVESHSQKDVFLGDKDWCWTDGKYDYCKLDFC